MGIEVDDTMSAVVAIAPGLAPGVLAGGRYRIIRAIGAGGMGEVFEAEDLIIGGRVALKALLAERASSAQAVERLRREIALARKVTHANVCRTHDLGDHEGRVFLTMELLAGETLADRIHRDPLPLDEARTIAEQIIAGLGAAHAVDVVHRDLKSANVVLVRDGERSRAVVTDFGLARSEISGEHGTLTGDGAMLGTAGYMAPEQVEGKLATTTSDIYALGVVLFEMVTGRLPFRGETPLATASLRLTSDPPSPRALRPDLPVAWEAAIGKCLARRPSDRFTSVEQVVTALRSDPETAVGRAVVAAPSIMEPRPRRRRVWIAAAIATTAVVSSVGAYWIATRHRQPVPAQPTFTPVTFRRGTVTTARFAPGETIVYTAAWDGGVPTTFTALLGRPDARLAFEPAVNLLAIAPDGRVALGLPVGKTKHTLARATLAGDVPRPILDGVDEADWIPGSDELAVLRNNRVAGGTGTVEFPIGKPVLHYDEWARSLRVAPDGKRIAVIVSDNYQPGLTVIDRAGVATKLLAGWREITGLAWSPDGHEIWLSGTPANARRIDGIYAVDLAGSVREVLRAPVSLRIQDIDRNGRVLLCSEVTTRNAEGRRSGEPDDRDLTWFDSAQVLAITDAGDRFLFHTEGQVPDQGVGCLSFIRALDGSPPVQLGECAIALSPDGTRAIGLGHTQTIAKRSDPSTHEQLVVLPTGAGETKRLPRGPLVIFEGVAFFADGRRIVVIATEQGQRAVRRLYVQDLDGGDPRAITPPNTDFDPPMAPVSPDGRWVFANERGTWRLFPVDGGAPHEIPGLQQGDKPLRWSTDRRLLVSRSVGQSRATIHAVDLADGTWQQLHEIGPSARAGISPSDRLSIAISLDGRSYVYSYTRRFSQLFIVDGLR